MDPLFAIGSILVGLLIGLLSGMLGIGGGMIMVPVFKLGYGLAAIGATATSLFSIIPTAVAGAITHVRQRTCIPLLGALAGIGGAITSPLGVHLATLSPGWAIMLAAALVIGYSSITMFRKALALPRTGSQPAAEQQQPTEAAAPAAQLGRRVWLGLPIGAIAGIVAGYVGVGGGFIMVPLFLSLMGVPMKLASGSSLVAIGILAIPGATLQLYLGNVEMLLALLMLAGSIPGATLGARLVKRIPERQLRFAFGAALAICAILMVVKELGIL